jgi:hypothetical protein
MKIFECQTAHYIVKKHAFFFLMIIIGNMLQMPRISSLALLKIERTEASSLFYLYLPSSVHFV